MIDTLNVSDAAAASTLSAGFSWPHRPEDWAFFLRLGRGVAWRENGALLGTAMFFPLDDRHGSIGLVQVAPGLQGRGIGRHLMQAAMALGAGRSLMLHATAAGAGLYARLGFEPHGVVEQWQGVVTQAAGTPHRLATSADLPAICALDRAASGLERTALLEALFADATVVLNGPAGAPTGYAMRRRFGRGALIGPVVASDRAEAETLFAGLLQPGFTRVDFRAGSGLAEAVGAVGLVSVEDVTVMVHGPWPTPPAGPSVFGLGAQAFG